MNFKKKVILSIIFFSSVAAVGAVFAACEDHTLLGFAWTENVGALSFSCKNCDTNNNGFIDSGACGGNDSSDAVYDYGVDIAENGKLSGYAWNEHVGSISFNISETNTPPGDYPCSVDRSCTARLQHDKIIGWARALSACNWDGSKCLDPGSGSNAGDWDGWIKFNVSGLETKISEFKLGVGPLADRYALTGWAFSSADDASNRGVIGKINMASDNYPTGNYYIVTSSIGPNHFPVADFECDNSSCSCGLTTCDAVAAPCVCYYEDGSVLNLKNLSNDPDDIWNSGVFVSSDILISKWFKANDDGSSFPVDPAHILTNDGAGKPAGLPLKELPGTYKVKLIVSDKKDEESMPKIITGIKFLRGLKADFDCSKDGTDWSVPCANISTEEGKAVWFRDKSVASESLTGIDGSINSWTWKDKNGTVFGDTGMASTTASMNTSEITLEVTDTNDHYDEETKQLKVIPLPRWKELLPF